MSKLVEMRRHANRPPATKGSAWHLTPATQVSALPNDVLMRVGTGSYISTPLVLRGSRPTHRSSDCSVGRGRCCSEASLGS